MLDDFLKRRLYIQLDDVTDEMLEQFEEIIGHRTWAHGARLNSEFTTLHCGHFICCQSNDKIYYDDQITNVRVPIIRLSDFVREILKDTIQFKDIDIMNVFTGEYDG